MMPARSAERLLCRRTQHEVGFSRLVGVCSVALLGQSATGEILRTSKTPKHSRHTNLLPLNSNPYRSINPCHISITARGRLVFEKARHFSVLCNEMTKASTPAR